MLTSLVENEILSGGAVVTLRGVSLDLGMVVRDLIEFGRVASSRWGMATPALSDQEMDLIYELSMREAVVMRLLAEDAWRSIGTRTIPDTRIPDTRSRYTRREVCGLLIGSCAMCAGFIVWGYA
jgi:hypothetical protein